jgi:hypothetical protein
MAVLGRLFLDMAVLEILVLVMTILGMHGSRYGHFKDACSRHASLRDACVDMAVLRMLVLDMKVLEMLVLIITVQEIRVVDIDVLRMPVLDITLLGTRSRHGLYRGAYSRQRGREEERNKSAEEMGKET